VIEKLAALTDRQWAWIVECVVEMYAADPKSLPARKRFDRLRTLVDAERTRLRILEKIATLAQRQARRRTYIKNYMRRRRGSPLASQANPG